MTPQHQQHGDSVDLSASDESGWVDFDSGSFGDNVSVSSSVFSQSYAGTINRYKTSSAGDRNVQCCDASCASNVSSKSHMSSRSGGSKRGRRLRVKFSPRVQCHDNPSRDSYTEAERAATWFSPEEGRDIKRRVLAIVQAMRKLHAQRVPADRVDAVMKANAERLGLVDVCQEDRYGEVTDRGLEHMRTEKAVENRNRHKLSVVQAVLDEQGHQWDEGLEPGREGWDGAEMRIAEASMVVSKLARNDAARKGRKDARFVEKSREEEETRSGLGCSWGRKDVPESSPEASLQKSQTKMVVAHLPQPQAITA